MLEYVLVFAALAMLVSLLVGLGSVIVNYGDRTTALTRMDCP